jgi:hypothetical protein
MNKNEILGILWHKCCHAIDLAVKGGFDVDRDVGDPFLWYLQQILHTSDKQDTEKPGMTGFAIPITEGLRTFRGLVRHVPGDCLLEASGSTRMKAYLLIISQKMNPDIWVVCSIHLLETRRRMHSAPPPPPPFASSHASSIYRVGQRRRSSKIQFLYSLPSFAPSVSAPTPSSRRV